MGFLSKIKKKLTKVVKKVSPEHYLAKKVLGKKKAAKVFNKMTKLEKIVSDPGKYAFKAVGLDGAEKVVGAAVATVYTGGTAAPLLGAAIQGMGKKAAKKKLLKGKKPSKASMYAMQYGGLVGQAAGGFAGGFSGGDMSALTSASGGSGNMDWGSVLGNVSDIFKSGASIYENYTGGGAAQGVPILPNAPSAPDSGEGGGFQLSPVMLLGAGLVLVLLLKR